MESLHADVLQDLKQKGKQLNEKQFATILGLVVAEVVGEIATNYKLEEIEAAKEFYDSKVYALLEKEETKLWHLSGLTLFNMFDEEKKKGTFYIPEEA